VAPTQLASLAFGGGQVIQFWASRSTFEIISGLRRRRGLRL